MAFSLRTAHGNWQLFMKHDPATLLSTAVNDILKWVFFQRHMPTVT